MWLLLFLSLASLVVPGRLYPTSFDNVTWDEDNWRLETTFLDQGHYQSRMSLGNGYLGINVAAVGPFFEVDSPVAGDVISGWPLFNRRQSFATVAGFFDSQERTNGTNYDWLYQYGGESVISGVPHWAGLVVQHEKKYLSAGVDEKQISNFRSTLDVRKGLFTWEYTWTPNNVSFDIVYSAFVHKLNVNQAAVQLSITPSEDANFTVIDVLEGDCAVRTDFINKSFVADSPTIWSAVRPVGISNVTAYIYSTLAGDSTVNLASRAHVLGAPFMGANDSSIAQAVTVNGVKNRTSVITKYIGGASTDAYPDPQSTAKSASLDGAATGYDTLLTSHIGEWNAIMPRDSVDSYALPDGSLPGDLDIVELHITSVTNTFYLLENTIGANAIAAAGNNSQLNVHSISVCGLGSDCYAGLIFWDAEVWMAPGLVVSHPDAAQQIARYRADKLPQAKENVKMAFESSQNATGKFSEGGAVYPWTSGRFGNCTGTGPCFDYEYHLNGDIGLQLYNYLVATGDAEYFKKELWPVYDAIAWFYGELLTKNGTDGKYVLTNATDPDEYANNIDNPGFTLPLIQTHLDAANNLRARFGAPLNKTWVDISKDITIPVNTDADIILEYSGMNGSISVKQADVVLIDDFLDFNSPYSLNDLNYYAAKQSSNGPGMTYGVFSIVANEISPSGCSAYTYHLYATQPYARAPWFQYSEQLVDDYTANGGTHPAYPFLTGMGGAHRVAIFGYLGLRLKLDSLNVDPNLPPHVQYLTYRTFYWQGHPVKAYSNQTHTVLSRPANVAPLAVANASLADAPIPVTIGINGTTVHPLSPGGELVLRNRQLGHVLTAPGNILQCHPGVSPQPYVPGQIPHAAIDGAISTKWQPRDNGTAWVQVDLRDQAPREIKRVVFDWAQNPALKWKVEVANASGAWDGDFTRSGVKLVAEGRGEVSSPWDDARKAEVVPYTSNTTSVEVGGAWSGWWARLTVEGSWLGGEGATVAEWVLVGA
ncbi:hypothetical protein EJ06DRAFT_480350 [Trichodelitschia bisporula]|uniref:alpha,alpha-trehalase n=1 Tax=Trichodelitschia bisporula TaxID=703511 RepID=A0A6G1HR87_9PEZI|nr:hypothetical protein EJ06DRAFT_480350 [Trichodelitschia bisporula]